MGGTSGIGLGIALELARAGFDVVVVGRNPARGAEAVRRLELAGGAEDASFAFARSDLSVVKNVKATCEAFAKHHARLDVLVMTQGRGSMRGWTDNGEGTHANVCVNYLGRVAAAFLLAPLLNASNDPRVLTVLAAGMHKPYAHAADDFAVREHFSFANQADAACSYTDVAFDRFATRFPKISTAHLYPGVVRTNWMIELPLLVRCLAWTLCGACLWTCVKSGDDVGVEFARALLLDERRGEGGYRCVSFFDPPLAVNI
jgi:NAD(P)-dependent dehydrogenase (short-subunit alcohol dehydrogenase family)